MSHVPRPTSSESRVCQCSESSCEQPCMEKDDSLVGSVCTPSGQTAQHGSEEAPFASAASALNQDSSMVPASSQAAALGQELSVSGHKSLEVLDLTGDPESWKCPVCLDLLHKPCVLRCGHVMCFWCMHFAMSPFTQSKCPLCREPYVHLPGVCLLLNEFLQQAFPKEYAQRARETSEDEGRYGIGAAQLPDQADNSPSQDQGGAFQPERFACSCCPPQDRSLSSRMHFPVSPVVLNCGHVHCGLSTSAGPDASPRLHHCVPPWNVMDACPQCSAPIIAAPTAVAQLDALLQKLFPELHAQRIAELQASTWPATWSSFQADAGTADQLHGSLPPLESTFASRFSSRPAAPRNMTVQPAPSETPAAGPLTILGDNNSSLATAFTDRFVHYRIGCDGCGVFPIVGKRYRCRDCPERIGFDLCDACHESNRHMAGRFNQQHTPDHTMELVHNAPSLLHILQATNPTMDPEQLRGLVAMGADSGAHAEAVQSLLELPLASSMRGTVPLSRTGSGSMERTGSIGRRRRASSPADEGNPDGSETASAPRRRRRNNSEAYVCIFAPPSTAGQGPHVAVAVYSRPNNRAAPTGDNASVADALAGTNSGIPGSTADTAPPEAPSGQLSAEQIAAFVINRRQARREQEHQQAQGTAPAETDTQTDAGRNASRQPLLRRLWTWATRPRWNQTSPRAP